MHDGHTIGVALGGGSTLGAAHIGALRAIQEAGVRPALVSGTSIGSLVAALYAFDLGVDAIEKIALTMNWLDVARPVLSKMGLLSNARLGKLLEEHLGTARIEDALLPLAMVATDIDDGTEVVLRKGDVARAVLASTCIPGLFAPVEIDGRTLVDGGLVNDVPVRPLREMGATFVIAVDLNAAASFDPVSNIVDVLVNSMRIAMREGSASRSREADLRIALDLSAYSVVNTRRSQDLVREGYESARSALQAAQLPGS